MTKSNRTTISVASGILCLLYGLLLFWSPESFAAVPPQANLAGRQCSHRLDCCRKCLKVCCENPTAPAIPQAPWTAPGSSHELRAVEGLASLLLRVPEFPAALSFHRSSLPDFRSAIPIFQRDCAILI
jgi:hypothetical protein